MKIRYKTAMNIVRDIEAELTRFGRVEVAGSIRRGKRLIGDIDVLGSSVKMTEPFLNMGERVIGQPYGKRATIMYSGVKIDLWIVPVESWATGLMQVTGSKEENIWLRGIAKRRGYCLNLYGLWYNGHNFAQNSSERDIYRILGVHYREPAERLGWLKT